MQPPDNPDGESDGSESLNEWLHFFQHLHNSCVKKLVVDYVEPFLSLAIACLNAGGELGQGLASTSQPRPRHNPIGRRLQFKVTGKIALGLYTRKKREYEGEPKVYGEGEQSDFSSESSPNNSGWEGHFSRSELYAQQ